MMQEIHIYVSGAVQGVGFRSTVKRHALLYNIKGFARNLPDGRVEICAQGKGDQINHFLQIIKEKPGHGTIAHIETKLHLIQETYYSFEIC